MLSSLKNHMYPMHKDKLKKLNKNCKINGISLKKKINFFGFCYVEYNRPRDKIYANYEFWYFYN